MACTQTISGLARDCSGNLGGVKAVYIAPYDSQRTVTVTSGEISTYTAGTSAPNYMRFNFRAGAASMTSTSQIDAVSGVNMIQTQLVMNFGRMETVKRTEIQALLQGEVQVIVVDNNDNSWFLSYNSPVVAIGSQNGQTGAAKTEANQYTITLQDESAELPYQFSDNTVYAGVITEV